MKRENLAEAKLTVKQIEEIETNISSLETLITKSSIADSNETLEVRFYGYIESLPTLHHILTHEDIIEVSQKRKDVLIERRRTLLNHLENL